MSLLGRKKEASGCCRGGAGSTEAAGAALPQGADVKVLGSGCAKCSQLEAATRAALIRLGMDSTIDHVTDFAQIAAFGVMTTPALVVDGKVVLFGRVPKTEELVELLQKARGAGNAE
ncbi:MAG: thioredoxin family protein [Oscillospiraceae bacterium]